MSYSLTHRVIRNGSVALALLFIATQGFSESRKNQIVASCSIPQSFPRNLSQTCLAQLLGQEGSAATQYSNIFEYAPQYPAYSDGATKRRWIYLPTGAQIDT